MAEVISHEYQILPVIRAKDADLQYLRRTGHARRIWLRLRKAREIAVIQHVLDFEQFRTRQRTFEYFGVVSVAVLQMKLAVMA